MGIMSWDLEYPAEQLRAALHDQDRRTSNEEPLEQSPNCVPGISFWTFSRAGRPAPTRRTRRRCHP